MLAAQVLEDILKDADPAKRGREFEITLIARLHKHLGNPMFTALGDAVVTGPTGHNLRDLRLLIADR